ncbi:hypothetical protein [Sphingomonas crocodyli]|uniref:hypothetical protein n=1 Tax=Sphingomonas crocodyli TaxID=1979270 RepID=UPI0019D313CE|nr:hypothetical protein [Sphingomonas crocodyli]
MTTSRTSRAAAINAKCRECIYDRLSVGNWREQVAACASSNCALHSVRPVPRSCVVDGRYDLAAISVIRAKLDRALNSTRILDVTHV